MIFMNIIAHLLIIQKKVKLQGIDLKMIKKHLIS